MSTHTSQPQREWDSQLLSVSIRQSIHPLQAINHVGAKMKASSWNKWRLHYLKHQTGLLDLIAHQYLCHLSFQTHPVPSESSWLSHCPELSLQFCLGTCPGKLGLASQMHSLRCLLGSTTLGVPGSRASKVRGHSGMCLPHQWYVCCHGDFMDKIDVSIPYFKTWWLLYI